MAKYESILGCPDIPLNSDIWACAYSYDNNKVTMGLRQFPVKGQIIEDKMGVKRFVSYKKDGRTLQKNGVSYYSRRYADTYEECVEIYNQLVQHYIRFFEQRLEEVRSDFIHDQE